MQTKRQTEIIEEAIQLINANGIQGLTIKNLSKAIGVSEPAIYRHFESKTDILLAILNNFKEVSAFINDSVKDMDDTAIGKIAFMFGKIMDIFANDPAHISVVFSEELFKNDTILQKKIVEIMDIKEEAIESIIAEGQKKGEIRTDIDHKTLALIIMGALRFRVKRWNLKLQHTHLHHEADELINGLKTILQP